ncbi:MAG TPA: hypothetical protein VGI22_29085 [Xanthobacteraceae bacterium]
MVIPLSVEMFDVFAQGPPRGTLTEENRLAQTLLLHRPDPALGALPGRRRRLSCGMAKRPTKQQLHSRAIYHLKGTPAHLVGIVADRPDEESAIKTAIEDFKVPANQRNRLIAQRSD